MGWGPVTGIYLTVQLAIFCLIKLIFGTPWEDLAGSYLCFATSFLTTFFLVWILNTWAFDRLSPRQIAVGAAVATAFLVISADASFAYLGLVLHLFSWPFVTNWTIWVFVVLPLSLFASVGVYRIAYRNMKIRKERKA